MTTIISSARMVWTRTDATASCRLSQRSIANAAVTTETVGKSADFACCSLTYRSLDQLWLFTRHPDVPGSLRFTGFPRSPEAALATPAVFRSRAPAAKLARCILETCHKGDARIGVVVHGDDRSLM